MQCEWRSTKARELARLDANENQPLPDRLRLAEFEKFLRPQDRAVDRLWL